MDPSPEEHSAEARREPAATRPGSNLEQPETYDMTTEKDKDQTRQNPAGENQDPNRKAPADHPSDPPTSGAPVQISIR